MKSMRYLFLVVILLGSIYSCTPDDPEEGDINNFNNEQMNSGGEDDDGTDDTKP